MKLRWIILLIVAWLVTPTTTQAQTERGSRGRAKLEGPSRNNQAAGRDARIARIRDELDLDEDQQAEFDRIAGEFRGKRAAGSDPQRQRSAGREARRGGKPIEQFFDAIEGILRDDQREKLAGIKQELAAKRGGKRGRGPLAQLDRLRGELKLSDEQAEQYDKLYADLTVELEQGQTGTDELVKQLMAAAEAGDTERIEELRTQLPGGRGRTSAAIADFLGRIEVFLEPEQVEILERHQRKADRGRDRPDLRGCFRFVSRFDLDEQQRQALRELQREARQSERQARRDPEARAQVTEDVLRELRAMLTQEQAAEFDEWRTSQKPDRRSRGQTADRPRRQPREEPPVGDETP